MPNDEVMKIIKWRFKTGTVGCAMAGFQAFLALLSICQHALSLAKYGVIFKCSFNQTIVVSEGISPFLRADYIVYDFGLFHHLWKIDECIANYMDGGYMRCLWCLGYLGAVGLLYLTFYLELSRPLWLYPLLIMQSTYCICILILTFSALPKLFKILFGDATGETFAMVVAFILGAVLNYCLNYVVWHYYWHVETKFKKRLRGNQYLEAQNSATKSESWSLQTPNLIRRLPPDSSLLHNGALPTSPNMNDVPLVALGPDSGTEHRSGFFNQKKKQWLGNIFFTCLKIPIPNASQMVYEVNQMLSHHSPKSGMVPDA